MSCCIRKPSDWRELFALCQPLSQEVYEPGHRDTFVSGSDSGFRLRDGNRLIVAIAGSDDLLDWIDPHRGNLQSSPVELAPGIFVHAGLLRSAQAIADIIARDIQEFLRNPAAELLFTGHSRGGAIAQILPLVLQLSSSCQVVTFGSPNVIAGDVRLEMTHFQNWNDVIAHLPVRAGNRVFHFTGRIIRNTAWGHIRIKAARTRSWEQFLWRAALLAVGVALAAARRRLLPLAVVHQVVQHASIAHSIRHGYAAERWCVDEA